MGTEKLARGPSTLTETAMMTISSLIDWIGKHILNINNNGGIILYFQTVCTSQASSKAKALENARLTKGCVRELDDDMVC